MSTLKNTYSGSLALLTDLYQITMAYGYWKTGTSTKEACFHLYFRENPFGGGYAIAAGLQPVLEYLENFRFDASDIEYLASLKGADKKALFEKEFLETLRDLKLSIDIDAVPEGTPIFAYEPLLRVTGPIYQCQLLETALLNLVNFQTLIATKASRICLAAEGDDVIEFGLRRAHGIDGGLSASRAAYIGGCNATSNVLAGKIYGIPVRGTHAHSWVMSFPTEREAFQKYAESLPNNCVFLVDTYNTEEGVKHAVEAGKWLQARGHRILGVRLDSGDLAYLSQRARKILDEGGFPEAKILASNDLDEHVIASLKQQGAAISVWGVGTRLVTAYDQPALGGVYKLSAVREIGKSWEHRIKVSEQTVKTTIPGLQQVRRYEEAGVYVGDAIYDGALGKSAFSQIIDPHDATKRKTFKNTASSRGLLVPAVRKGKRVYVAPPLRETREHASSELKKFHPAILRMLNPHVYPVGLSPELHALRTELILKARGGE